MRDNIALMLDGSTTCWAAKFLTTMANIGVISHSSLTSCLLVENCTSLPIDETIVKDKLHSLWVDLCRETFGKVVTDPRSFPDSIPVTYVRYRTWVDDNQAPKHLSAFIPNHIKHMLIRFRCTSFPLAIQIGRNSKKKIPRSQRLCKACCMACVEDDKHFLLECPAYKHIRQEYPAIFANTASPANILNFPNQGILGNAMKSMLALRKTII